MADEGVAAEVETDIRRRMTGENTVTAIGPENIDPGLRTETEADDPDPAPVIEIVVATDKKDLEAVPLLRAATRIAGASTEDDMTDVEHSNPHYLLRYASVTQTLTQVRHRTHPLRGL